MQSMEKMARGIRGATVVDDNNSRVIIDATRSLLEIMLAQNRIDAADIVGIWFTVSPDLNAAFPAQAGRELGLTDVAMMCSPEIDVPGAIASCVRVMMLVNTTATQSEMMHIYCGEAARLRPEWAWPR